MIEVFKITHEIYDPDVSLKLVYHPNSNTSIEDRPEPGQEVVL